MGPGAWSEGVVQDAAELGALMPYERASRTYNRIAGVAISANSIRRVVDVEGTGWARIEQQAAETTWKPPEKEAVPAPREMIQADSPRMNVSLDGTTIHIRGEGWKEVKTATFSALVEDEQARKRRKRRKKAASSDSEPAVRLTQHSYRAGLWDARRFEKQQWAEAKRRGVPAAEELLSINDGAIWIWRIILTCYPQAIEIVDWWHAVERLWQVGHLVYGQDSSVGAAWVKIQETALWHGDVESVIEACQALMPARAEAIEYVRQSIGYFETNRERMRYAQFRAAGYPIGSGAVEGGGCKMVVGGRMKQAGMRWSRRGAQAVLALRTAWFSDRWDEVWARSNRSAA